MQGTHGIDLSCAWLPALHLASSVLDGGITEQGYLHMRCYMFTTRRTLEPFHSLEVACRGCFAHRELLEIGRAHRSAQGGIFTPAPSSTLYYGNLRNKSPLDGTRDCGANTIRHSFICSAPPTRRQIPPPPLSGHRSSTILDNQREVPTTHGRGKWSQVPPDSSITVHLVGRRCGRVLQLILLFLFHSVPEAVSLTYRRNANSAPYHRRQTLLPRCW